MDRSEKFATNGFVKGDVVLNDAEVGRSRVDLDRVLASETVKKPALAHNLLEHHLPLEMQVDETVVQIVSTWRASEAFLVHARHPRFCSEVAQLTGSDTLRTWVALDDGDDRQRLHVDGPWQLSPG